MKTLILLISTLMSFQVFAAAWSVENQWSLQWEDQYANWVRKNWKQTVFTSPDSVYYGLKTDCADATYSMRALFAYENKLPFLVHTADGKKLDQDTAQFDNVAEGKARFREFIKYVFQVTDTGTLGADTFPVAINRNSIKPGTVYVSPGVHSYQIVDLDNYGIITTMSSTTPETVRVLFRNHGYPFYMPSSFTKFRDGYRAFRWPSEFNEPISRLRRASTEQFQWAEAAQGNYFEFTDKLIKRLKLETEPLEDVISRSYENLCYFTRERAVLTIRAYAKRLDENITCYNKKDWDDYSTVNRDKRLKSYFTSFRQLRYDSRWEDLDSASRAKLMSVFVSNISFKGCVVETSMPQKPYLELYEVWKLIDDNKLIDDPNADVLQRWGLKPYRAQCQPY